ncbi:hypothetical protein GDO81_017556 [Engystomops pustulosus]|uniref:Uncharacterized protein n=1 Tax=Engystomops pustulosus TaxID=76066 RepID=A0AAV7A6F0_ENGPU|nr:hypothetical protein GDO81_017556 [Engystomops pustulosus]
MLYRIVSMTTAFIPDLLVRGNCWRKLDVALAELRANIGSALPKSQPPCVCYESVTQGEPSDDEDSAMFTSSKSSTIFEFFSALI